MIASLMMYQRPELVVAHENYWQLIRDNLKQSGIESPETLSQDAEEFHVWNHPDLVLSQTCGMPYRTWLHDKVELVGTPDFGLEGCAKGYYRSALIVHDSDPRTELEDFRDGVFAYNQTFSQSGYAAPYWHFKPKGFWFENKLHTGQHLNSARAVASSKADIASIDAMSWRLMLEYDNFAQNLRVLQWTEPTPSLPLITASGNDVDTIFNALEKSINQLNAMDRRVLHLKGITKIEKERYLEVPNP